MNDTSFTLSWEVPESDGGSKITEYIVEIKEFQETKYRLFGSTNGNTPNIRITNVVKSKAYTFRIYAKNEIGTSEALETDKIVVTKKISMYSDDDLRNLIYFLKFYMNVFELAYCLECHV